MVACKTQTKKFEQQFQTKISIATVISFFGDIMYFLSVRNNVTGCQHNTLLALITPALSGVIFRDMALKGPALYVCL